MGVHRTRREVDFVIVSQYFPPERGAAQIRLGALCLELTRAGHTVEVVTALPSYPTGRIFPGWRRRPSQVAVEGGVRVVRVWVWAAMGSGYARIANYLSFGLMAVLGLARTGRARWTVVEYPTLFGAVAPLLWARARGGRTVLIVADLWVDVIAESGALKGRLVIGALRRLERWVLRRSDAVTVVTEGLRAAVLAKGVDPTRVCWLPNGVDTGLFRPRQAGAAGSIVAPPQAADETPPMVLYAGTHGHVHGLEVVLGAAERLADRPVRLLLVGGGSEKPALVAAARERQLGNVEFREPVAPEEVARLLGRARIGLASVRGEPIYRSVRSAKIFPVMASGVPVIYSGDDEGSALVTAAGAGLAVPPGDADALAGAIARLLDDPAEADRMGRAGRAWVEAHAGWHRLVEDWIAQLDDPAHHRSRGLLCIDVVPCAVTSR
jgi:glycosyltransferase involved in cell wall biosynthesis